MQKTFCDRCDKQTGRRYDNHTIEINSGKLSATRVLDLCDECVMLFFNLFYITTDRKYDESANGPK